jgi:hypothetical protein
MRIPTADEFFAQSPVAPLLTNMDRRIFPVVVAAALGIAAGLSSEKDREAVIESAIGEFTDGILARELLAA